MALSASFSRPAEAVESISSKEDKPSARRRQLHILYLLNDLLHHTKYHSQSSSAYSTLTGSLQPYLVDLFGTASACDPRKHLRHYEKVNRLLGIWDRNGYYHSTYIEKLRETVANAPNSGEPGLGRDSMPLDAIAEGGSSEPLANKKDVPFIMPATHGDPSTPFYDLPAGNMMPHIIPNSTTPINPQLVKPLQFIAGPADESLIVAIKKFMKDVDTLARPRYEEVDDVMTDIDELGQTIIRDETTKELLGGEGYYGWSKAFCERLKRRRDGPKTNRRIISRNESSDRSISPRKRRRYSYSESSRSRSRSRSFTNSRSRSREQPVHPMKRNRRQSYSRSRSLSRDNSHPEAGLYRSLRSRSHSSPRSRSKSYSPLRRLSPPQQYQSLQATNLQRPLSSQAQVLAQPPPLPFLNALTQGFPVGPGGVPIPPPRPPNYTGPWPPPPPPPLARTSNAATQGISYPTFPLSSGPRSFSTPGLPLGPTGSTGNQSQMPTNNGSWGLQQQQNGNGAYTYDENAAMSPYIGQSHSDRGRGSRGGWR